MKPPKELLSCIHLGDHEATGIIRGILLHNITPQVGCSESLLSLRFLVDTEDSSRVACLNPLTLARLSKSYGNDLAKWFGKKIKLYRHQNDAGEWFVRIYPVIE